MMQKRIDFNADLLKSNSDSNIKNFMNLTYITEVESRTQGSRPRPRPRTQKKSEAKAKAKDSLFEDRTSRGQGQERSRPRPRTKDTGASVLRKKSLQKFFSGDLQFISVPRIFDWGRLKPQITCNDVIKIFPKRKFLFDKDIVGWKI